MTSIRGVSCSFLNLIQQQGRLKIHDLKPALLFLSTVTEYV
ncbi:hypothetical protein PAEVO_60330 [Paenibacillus sp. GM2FR]|nr:hypothetical protein PAEVO_60330 [Paenibacillus sp. GM2FR]